MWGYTPLHYVATFAPNAKEMVTLLCPSTIKPDEKLQVLGMTDQWQATPLSYAALYKSSTFFNKTFWTGITTQKKLEVLKKSKALPWQINLTASNEKHLVKWNFDKLDEALREFGIDESSAALTAARALAATKATDALAADRALADALAEEAALTPSATDADRTNARNRRVTARTNATNAANALANANTSLATTLNLVTTATTKPKFGKANRDQWRTFKLQGKIDNLPVGEYLISGGTLMIDTVSTGTTTRSWSFPITIDSSRLISCTKAGEIEVTSSIFLKEQLDELTVEWTQGSFSGVVYDETSATERIITDSITNTPYTYKASTVAIPLPSFSSFSYANIDSAFVDFQNKIYNGMATSDIIEFIGDGSHLLFTPKFEFTGIIVPTFLFGQ
jgi:hypothetical protein